MVATSHHRDYIRVKATVEDVESLFPGLQLHDFTPIESSRMSTTIVRSLVPARVPESLQDAVETIYGLHDFPFARRRKSSLGNDFLGIKITPDILLPYYNISSEGSPMSPKSLQAVAEFQQEYFYPYDPLMFSHCL
jgi:hypothetical protein